MADQSDGNLAATANVDPRDTRRALTRLAADGVVVYDPDEGVAGRGRYPWVGFHPATTNGGQAVG